MREESDPLGARRGRLLGLAYRMLGSRADAEDILQEAWLRYAQTDPAQVENEDAFLVRIVTRLCLDQLKSARAKREVYVGPWLPEPVFDADMLSPSKALELADDLSFALLLTLERLSPSERAAFLLHDVFEAPFSEVAAALGKSEAACRRLAARARKSVRAARSKYAAPREKHEALLASFAAAIAQGDEDRLRDLLAADAVALSDGGGLKAAALNPISGADRIARFLVGIRRKAKTRGVKFRHAFARVNGEPAILQFSGDLLDATISIATDGARISAVYLVRNPEKLSALTKESRAIPASRASFRD
ncbi:MAG: RNA polymerase sigma-70 factor [Alphaproteobacteria bacterium]|nr:RNA polymerase sigma-70 factor [Alphaproteobacteria bacterium]